MGLDTRNEHEKWSLGCTGHHWGQVLSSWEQGEDTGDQALQHQDPTAVNDSFTVAQGKSVPRLHGVNNPPTVRYQNLLVGWWRGPD